jgi:hypothetical protein
MAMERAERQLSTYARANQNVVAAATLLDTLQAPSTDRMGDVYQRLKSILSTTAVQQVESSLQHLVKASTLPPVRSKDRGQRVIQGALEAGMASSLTRISAYDLLSQPDTRSKPQVYR